MLRVSRKFARLIPVAAAVLLFSAVPDADAQQRVVLPCDVLCEDPGEPPTEVRCEWRYSYDCRACADMSRKPTWSLPGPFLPIQYSGMQYGKYYCGNTYIHTSWAEYQCGRCPVT